MVPAEIKSKALKRAWVKRCRVARVGMLRAIVATISPSCLRVERAMIFFRSHSTMADSPAINIVAEAVKSNIGLRSGTLDIVG